MKNNLKDLFKFEVMFSGFSRPALRFEFETQCTGIGRDYIFPKRLKAIDVNARLKDTKDVTNFLRQQQILTSQSMSVLMQNHVSRELIFKNILLKELKALNPELENLKYNKYDPSQIHNVLLGIVSGFNIDDINQYIAEYKISDQERLERRAYQMLISYATGVYIQWSASPETLAKIKDQCGIPENYPKESDVKRVLSVCGDGDSGDSEYYDDDMLYEVLNSIDIDFVKPDKPDRTEFTPHQH